MSAVLHLTSSRDGYQQKYEETYQVQYDSEEENGGEVDSSRGQWHDQSFVRDSLYLPYLELVHFLLCLVLFLLPL
jgi:hypothetical protein